MSRFSLSPHSWGLALLAASALGTMPVSAAPTATGPGALDSGFNTTGVVTTAVGSTSQGYAVALQPDGKIVVAGNNGGSKEAVLARYNADGTLDANFDAAGSQPGTVSVALGSSGSSGAAVAVLPTGKIILAGSAYSGPKLDFAVARFNGNGSPDTAFNGTGKAITAIGSGNDQGTAVVVQPDGDIVVAGSSQVSSASYDFALARYTPSGSLDSGFGNSGTVTTAIGSGTKSFAYAAAIQPDGKILLAGSTESSPGGSTEFALARYDSDGSLDTTFGGGTGIVTTSLGTGNAAIEAVALQPNGDIVVAGYATQSSSGQDFAVARYKPDGALDTGFGNGGTVITPVGSSTTDGAQSVVVQPDGRIVAAGYSGASSQYQLALARYDADGSLDTAFNASGSKPGTVTTTVGSAPDSRIYAAALEPDGKIVVGGASGSSSAYKVMVARYIAVNSPWGLTPDAFSFSDATGVPAGSTQTSNVITVSGLEPGVSVPVVVSGGEYAKNGSTAYTSDPGWATNGDEFNVRQTAAAAANASADTTLQVGGLVNSRNPTLVLGGPTSDTYTSTTGQDPSSVPPSSASSGGGGGCTVNPHARFDPTLYLVALIAALYLYRRRRQAGG